MDSGNIIKFDLTLEKQAAISAAARFWDFPNIKKEIDKCFKESKATIHRKLWNELTNTVLKLTDTLLIPEKLACDVKEFVIKIGDMIYDFTNYVTKHLGFDIKCAQKIFWGSYGKIDDIKIIEDYWLKEENFPPLTAKFYLNNTFFRIAALYANVDFIEQNLEKMKKDLGGFLSAPQMRGKWTVYGTLSTWICFCTEKTKTGGLRSFKSFSKPPNELPANGIFLLCVSNDLFHAAKYYWDKIDVSEQETAATSAAETCMDNLSNWYSNYKDNWYKYYKAMDIMILAINNMSEIQRMQFISENFNKLFRIFLKKWPYQELCVELLNKNLSISLGDLEELFKLIVSYLSPGDDKKTIIYKCRIYHVLFQTILERLSKEMKENYFVTEKNYLKEFHEHFDYVSISIIVHDKDLRDYREMFIAESKNLLKDKILDGMNFSEVDKFIKYVFSDEEKKMFKEELNNFLKTLLTCGKFDLAVKLLDWLNNTDSEKFESKNKICGVEVCLNLISKNRFDLADQFLELQFDQEKRSQMKKLMYKSDDYLCNGVYRIWGSRDPGDKIDLFIQKCSEFLNWFLESEAAVNEFRKNKLIHDEFFVEKYWSNLCCKDVFNDIDKFLEFCFWPPKNIQELKKKIADNIIWWIDTFAVEKNNFMLVDALMKWVFSDDVPSRKRIINEYMNSPKGALLCVSIFKNKCNFPSPTYLQLFKKWMVDVNFSEMKAMLFSFDETIAKKTLITRNMSLLKTRTDEEKGQKQSRWRKVIVPAADYDDEPDYDSRNSCVAI